MTHKEIEELLKQKLDWDISGEDFENLVAEKAGIDGIEEGEGFTVAVLAEAPNYYITVEYSASADDFKVTGIWGFK